MVAQLFMEAYALKMGLAWPYVNLHRHGDWKDTETFSRSDHFVTCICFLLRTKTLSYLKFSLHPNIVQISNYVMPSIAGRNASLQATRTWCALVKSENSGDIAPSICFKINKKVSTGLENAVAGNTQMERSKTAHVKFQLQKECMFGDEFLLVGDDPILGLWNPTDAVPMNWSEGHIWSVELDVPIESTIQFKFILKQGTGDMIWQPGSDRIFKSWESKGTVVIAEDWENPEAQKITEEQITDQIEEVHQREMLIVPMSNRLSFSGHFSEAS